jgi:hypothetical protein
MSGQGRVGAVRIPAGRTPRTDDSACGETGNFTLLVCLTFGDATATIPAVFVVRLRFRPFC